MGIALFTLNGLFGPLETLMAGFMPRSRAAARAGSRSCARPAPLVQPVRGDAEVPACPAMARAARPLRIVRVSEPRMPVQCAGRMVISGRMADVCAELDRLAAQEVQRELAFDAP